MRKTCPFIIVSTQRSGSVFLESCLKQHPEIDCFPEFLLPDAFKAEWSIFRFLFDKIGIDPRYSRAIAYEDDRKKLFSAYLDEVFYARKKPVLGADIKYGQELPFMWQTFNERSFKAIQLIRCNLLKCHVSRVMNRLKHETGRRSHETRKVPVHKLFLPIDTLIEDIEFLFRLIKGYHNLLSKMFKDNYIQISYESLFSGNLEDGDGISETAAKRLYNFLGVNDRQMQLTTEFKKLNPSRLRDFIINYQEVVELLSSTRWGFLLTDDKEELVQSWDQLWTLEPGINYFDFIMPEDSKFQAAVNICLHNSFSKIAVYGSRRGVEKIFQFSDMAGLSVSAILNHSGRGELFGHTLVSPQDFDFDSVDAIVIPSKLNRGKLYGNLLALGVPESKIIKVYR